MGLWYSIVQIRVFGTSKSIEIYFAAQSIAYLATSLSQSGQLSEIFMPEYVRTREKLGREQSNILYSSIANRVAIYVTMILAILFLLAPMLVKLIVPGFGTEDKEIVVLYFRLLLPFIFFTIQFAFLNTILNAENVYGRTEIGSIISILVSITLVLVYGDEIGSGILIITSYLGIFIQIVLSLIFAVRVGIRYSFVYTAEQFDYQTFFSKIKSTLSYTVSTQALNVAYNAGLSFMPQGVFAVFQYVWKIFPKLSGIITHSISTVYFTVLTKKITDDEVNQDEIDELLFSIQKVALQISLVLSSAYFFMGHEILKFLWVDNKFSLANLLLADKIFKVLFFLFLFQTSYAVVRKYVVALGMAKYIYNYQAISQGLSALLVFILLKYFGDGGLLLGIFCANFMLMVVPFVILKRFGSLKFLLLDMTFIRSYIWILISTVPIWLLWGNYSLDLFSYLGFGLSGRSVLISFTAYAVWLVYSYFILGFSLSKTSLGSIDRELNS